MRLQAGAAKTDITPPLGTSINGDFYPHYAHNIHDPLHAKAIILSDNSITLLFIIVDICTMPSDYVDDLRNKISKATGLANDHIIISSTHTHAAGAVHEVYLGALDHSYRTRLSTQLVNLAVSVLEKMRPAKVCYSQISVPEFVRCRRYFMEDGPSLKNPVTGHSDLVKTNPFGLEKYIKGPVAPPNDELSFLAIKGLDEQWISVLANYSLHYAGDWENGTITADYFGQYGNYLEDNLDNTSGFVGIMTNGTCGDINIWNFNPDEEKSPPFELSRKIGHELARKTIKELAHCTWQENISLSAISKEISLEVRKPSAPELDSARKNIGYIKNLKRDYSDESLRIIYAREQILLNEMSDQCICRLQVIKIGELLIGILPGEFFAQTGLSIKNHCNENHYFSIGLANGNIGYVPPAEQFELGGYETWRSRYSCLEIKAEEKIRHTLLNLIEKIKKR